MNMNTDRILIVGASGTVGKGLLEKLKHEGYRTRATTSKVVKASDELVSLNLVTGEGIRAAFEGVDRAFFLSPPGHADQYALLSPLIQEAKRRGLKKVVLMTAMGANAFETPFRKAEKELESSGLNYNIIRPNWFLQNFNTFWIQGIIEQNKIMLPAGKAPVSFIDARDISNVAAKLLTSDGFDRRDFDLTGPEAVDHDQVAAAISQVSGRQIVYEELAPAEFKTGLVKAGLPAAYADLLVMLFGALREGFASRKTTSVKDITGQSPRSLSEYSLDYKNSWIK